MNTYYETESPFSGNELDCSLFTTLTAKCVTFLKAIECNV